MSTSFGDAGFTFATGETQSSAAAPQIISLTAPVASNAMTVTLNPTLALMFRSTTLSSGVPQTIVNISSPVVLVVPSGASLGHVNGVAGRDAIVAINNAGTVELAIINLAGGNDLSETGLISTTAISASSTASNVFYSTTARTNVAYRVVGFVDSTQATAGTWATTPSLVQGVGGQAFAAMSSHGYGQTWQNLTGSRALSTTYYNTTGKPIQINVSINGGTTTTLTVNGAALGSYLYAVAATIPIGASYNVASGSALFGWNELR